MKILKIILIICLINLSFQQVKITSDTPLVKALIPRGMNSKVLMWGKQDTMEDQTLLVKTAQPKDGCEPYTNADTTGKYAYYIASGGACSLGTKVHNAQVAGATALFIQYERNNLNEIVPPDHINGVNIPVIETSHDDTAGILDVLDDVQHGGQINLTLNYKAALANKEKPVHMKIYYSPEDYQGTRFLGDLANSLFMNDILKHRVLVETHFVILHCKYCEDRNYATMKENCLSGGRYCALPSRDGLKGERVLMQDLYNICVRDYSIKNDKYLKYSEFLYQFDKVCVNDMEITCTKKLVEKLGLSKEIDECIQKSINKKGDKPRIFLDDNYLLAFEKSHFERIKHFNRFPLLMINDIVYYGKIDTTNVMSFICSHVRDNLTGCKNFINKIEQKKGHGFTIFVTILVAGLFLWLFNKCRISLRMRFENEMNLQVDDSINKFLAKTGGNSL